MIGKRVVRGGLGFGLFGGMSKRAARKIPASQRVINATSREVFNTARRKPAPVIRGALPSASRSMPVHVPGRGSGFSPGRNLPVMHSGPNWRFSGGVAATRRQAQNASAAAVKGKAASRAVLGAAVGLPILGAFNNNTGPASTKPMGRPTGPYMY